MLRRRHTIHTCLSGPVPSCTSALREGMQRPCCVTKGCCQKPGLSVTHSHCVYQSTMKSRYPALHKIRFYQATTAYTAAYLTSATVRRRRRAQTGACSFRPSIGTCSGHCIYATLQVTATTSGRARMRQASLGCNCRRTAKVTKVAQAKVMLHNRPTALSDGPWSRSPDHPSCHIEQRPQQQG